MLSQAVEMAHFMAIEVTDGGLLLPLSNKFIQPLERCLDMGCHRSLVCNDTTVPGYCG